VRDRPGRRDAIDVARVLALLVVVAGHLALAVVDRVDGELRGTNLLRLRPGWAWAAALAPMPVFFAAAGWANATATLASATARARTLAGLGAVVVTGWSVAVVATTLVAGDAGIVADGARIATQPLWFLAAYVPFAASGAWLARQAARHPVRSVGACLGALAALDVARFAGDAPDWVGWPAFFVAWVVPWLVGAWWRDRWAAGWRGEARVGLALLAAGALGAAALVAWAGYAAPLIDAVPGQRSNSTPPTLYTAVVALAQAGALLAGARGFDAAGRRWRALWDRAGEAAVGVYVWHLTALALCLAGVAAGLPAPERLSGLWWATRPAWWALVLGVTAGFVAATAAVRARLHPRDERGGGVAGVVVTAGAAALVGLEGPRTAALAVACSALFVAGWWLLGYASTSRPRLKSS